MLSLHQIHKNKFRALCGQNWYDTTYYTFTLHFFMLEFEFLNGIPTLHFIFGSLFNALISDKLIRCFILLRVKHVENYEFGVNWRSE